MKYRDWIFLFVILFVAALVRISFLYSFSSTPFFLSPVVDAHEHHRLAMLVFQGDWRELFFNTVTKPPLFLWILSAFYFLFGPSALSGHILNLTLGIGNAALLFFLARLRFSSTVAFSAGLLFSFFWPAVLIEGQIFMEPLFLFLTLLWMIYVLSHARPGVLQGVVEGVLFAAMCLTRPVAFFCLPAVIYRFLSSNEKKILLVFVIVFFLMLFPTAWRNYVQAGSLNPVSVNGGINFFLSNNSDISAALSVRPSIAWKKLLREPNQKAGRMISFGLQDRYWYHKGFSFLRAYPWKAFKLYGRKFLLSIHHREINRNLDLYWLSSLSPWLPWNPIRFLLIFLLAGVGIFSLRKKIDPRDKFIFLFLMGMEISLLIFITSGRYRYPFASILILYSAYGLHQLPNWFRTSWLPKTGMILALSIVTGFSYLPVYFNTGVRMKYLEASSYLASNQLDKAFSVIQSFLSTNPLDADAWTVKAFAHYRMGQLSLARSELRNAIRLNPEADNWTQYGEWSMQIGDMVSARQACDRSIQLYPFLSYPYSLRGRLLVKEGRWKEAGMNFETALKFPPFQKNIANVLFLMRMKGLWPPRHAKNSF